MSTASSDDLIDLASESDVRPVTDDCLEKAHDPQKLQDALPLTKSRDAALDIALAAAELSMRALKLAQDPATKKSLSSKVKSLLKEAERIKHSDQWRTSRRSASPRPSNAMPSPDRIRKLKEPASTRQPSKAEQILILKASHLNGFKFPPWLRPPDDSEFQLAEGEEPFLDQPVLHLSPAQLKHFDGWRRAKDALPPPRWFPDGREGLGPTMSSLQDTDLVQDAATDCSVVASLCSLLARTQRGHQRILPTVMYPWDSEHTRPSMPPNGKHIMRLNFNGAYRRVEIDDRLPVSKTSRVLHVIDRRNPGLLWPALVEKAYLKIRGGYDFPGSNSGTDLWILTGWIPEQVFLQNDEISPNDLWARVYKAHGYGDVIITMGTGRMSNRSERELGLAGEHDYAVLDLREVDGQKLLLVKNPWCEGTSWRGSIALPEKEADGDGHTQSGGESELVLSSRDLLNADDDLSPGTFWMDLNSVLQHFESIYLNWNPGLFKYRQDVHFLWDLAASLEKRTLGSGSLIDCPQFTINVEDGDSTWLLLSRHFQNETLDNQAAVPGSEAQMTGFVGLHAFDANGSKVYLSEGSIARGHFVDSPQTLLRLELLKPGCPYTIVPAEHDLPPGTHTFTISAFANSALTLGQAPQKYPCQTVVSGSWNEHSAGGNASSPTYAQNPQYKIIVPTNTPVALLLHTPAADLNVHVKLLHSQGKRVQAVRSRDIVVDSHDYRRGSALAAHAAPLPAGTYTIIVSTFEPAQHGPFTLRIDSTHPVHLVPLPRADAGRIKTSLSPAAFRAEQHRVAAPLVPKRLAKLAVVARHLDMRTQGQGQGQQQRSMVRVTLELGTGPERRILIASGDGEYGDAGAAGGAGVRTEDIDVAPAPGLGVGKKGGPGMWLVVERMFTPRGMGEEMLGVDLFCDAPDAVAVGVWRSWD